MGLLQGIFIDSRKFVPSSCILALPQFKRCTELFPWFSQLCFCRFHKSKLNYPAPVCFRSGAHFLITVCCVANPAGHGVNCLKGRLPQEPPCSINSLGNYEVSRAQCVGNVVGIRHEKSDKPFPRFVPRNQVAGRLCAKAITKHSLGGSLGCCLEFVRFQ